MSNLARKYTGSTIFTAYMVYTAIVCWHFHTHYTGTNIWEPRGDHVIMESALYNGVAVYNLFHSEYLSSPSATWKNKLLQKTKHLYSYCYLYFLKQSLSKHLYCHILIKTHPFSGAKVYLACRDDAGNEEFLTEMKTRTKRDKIFIMKCDLSSFKSIQSFVDAFKKSKSLFCSFNSLFHY